MPQNSRHRKPIEFDRSVETSSNKYRKQLKENKKHDKDTFASHKKVAAEIEVKLKIRESEF